MSSSMSREPKPSKPIISPNKAGRNFRARFSGGALFSVLLLVLIGWVSFLGVMVWLAVSSLFG
jgi:hypothetical protein